MNQSIEEQSYWAASVPSTQEVDPSPLASADIELLRFIKPEPGPNELLVRVTRAGVSFGDVIRSSLGPFSRNHRDSSLPWVPGYDIAGVIEKIGPLSPRKRDHHFNIGQRIAALAMTGGYAQYVCIASDLAVAVPDEVGDDAACTASLNYLSAWQMMFRNAKLPKLSISSGLRPKLFVSSAAGGVGSAVLDIASMFGFRSVGSASHEKRAFVESFGADFVSREGHQTDIGQEQFDAWFEARGVEAANSARINVSKQGSIVLYGFLEDYQKRKLNSPVGYAFRNLPVFLRLFGKRIALYMVNPLGNNRRYRQDMQTLMILLAQGGISPRIHRVYPLSQTEEAWKELLTGRVMGKILLDPWSE